MKAIILDGYVDEPACFGVPPYLSPYPRYTAGALIDAGFKEDDISYFTIDTVRALGKTLAEQFKSADVFIIISGMTVPGKYLRGTPITAEEIRALFRLTTGIKILGGPIRLGYSAEGGVAATGLSFLPEDVMVAQNDVESFVYDCFSNFSLKNSNSMPSAYPPMHRYRTAADIAVWSRKGAFIAKQHPEFPNLICELETYRGCGRKKHCSFCTESFYGKPDFREEEDIIAETELLYNIGVRHFRIGRQPDLFAYKGIDDGGAILKPNPAAIEKLYSGIRRVAPDLKTLHMDNGNPITIAEYLDESREILNTIVKYHTPGDIIAMGIESADPAVIAANGLKATPEQVLAAVRLVNEVGAKRGANGMPEILPGINFVYGLLGETKKTYQLNYDFLKQIYDEGLMVRRINLRQVMVFPKTALSESQVSDFKNEKLFRAHKEQVRKNIDLPMLQRVVPVGTVLKNVFMEVSDSKSMTFGRQFGTYPLLAAVPADLELNRFYDVLVTNHGFRSVTGVPYPVNVNSAPLSILKELPGLNKSMAEELILKRPYKDEVDLLNRFKHGKLILKFVDY
ncbi:MAG: radical SAM protein [Methanosarcinales archaeon]|jgi:radical SAM superfamily enzyme with C-terminal helix-hairpin-helix motif|nr:radical SAM protein [Methanosarcinales archaeon]